MYDNEQANTYSTYNGRSIWGRNPVITDLAPAPAQVGPGVDFDPKKFPLPGQGPFSPQNASQERQHYPHTSCM